MTKPQQFSGAVTTGVAAKRLGVSLRCVQLWCISGALGCYTTVGGHRRVYEADIAKMLRDMRTTSVSVQNPDSANVEELVKSGSAVILLAHRLQAAVDKGSLDRAGPQKDVALAVLVLKHYGISLNALEPVPGAV